MAGPRAPDLLTRFGAEVVCHLAAAIDVRASVAARDGEVARSALDARRARAVLGWAPQVPLAVGLAETVSWVRDHRAGLDAPPSDPSR